MSRDYAAELLGGSQQAEPTRDYASELLGGGKVEASVTRPVEVESKGASFGALVKSSMVDDPSTKIEIFAKSRFPKDKDALQRYGIIDGEIVYLDTDGKIKKESPSGISGFWKELAAGMIGQAPAVVGGTVGAVLGAPAGPATAAGGAALGAAGGKGISQVLANLMFNEPQTVAGNVQGMATEGAVNAATTYVGSKLSQKIAERFAAKDISKLNRAEAEELVRKAKELGIDLNAAQATNLPSVKGRYEVLGRLESSMDIIDADRVRQGTQAGAAASTFMDKLSPAVSTRAAGERARSGATEVLERITKDRATAAGPWYEKALNVPVNLADEEFQRVSATPAFKQAWERAQRIAANEGVDLGDAANSMRALHYVKLGLGDLIEKGGTEGVGATEKRAIVGVQNRLLRFMDTASPDYARARSIYGHYMPTLKGNREGLIGQLSELADMDLNTAAKHVFGPQTSPEDVRKLRSSFFRYDQGAKWNDLFRSYLQDTFEQAGREFKTPGSGGVRAQAATWRAQMVGNPAQAKNIRAAMTEPQLKGFNDMMDVFEALGRVTGAGGSPTMPLQQANKQLTREATGVAPDLLQPRQAVINWLTEARTGAHAAEMARVMTDPKSLEKLKQLKQMSVVDKRFWAGFSSLFGIGNQSDSTPEDRPIPRK